MGEDLKSIKDVICDMQIHSLEIAFEYIGRYDKIICEIKRLVDLCDSGKITSDVGLAELKYFLTKEFGIHFLVYPSPRS